MSDEPKSFPAAAGDLAELEKLRKRNAELEGELAAARAPKVAPAPAPAPEPKPRKRRDPFDEFFNLDSDERESER